MNTQLQIMGALGARETSQDRAYVLTTHSNLSLAAASYGEDSNAESLNPTP